MKPYLQIVSNVLDKGKMKDNRTGTRTLTLPNQFFSHDMSEGFPLLTTKKMPMTTIAVELEGFINGITSKKWYRDRGCNIWNKWANPEAVEKETTKRYMESEWKVGAHYGDWNGVVEDPEYLKIEKQVQEEIDDLGPIYGYQWRSFNKRYSLTHEGTSQGEDQLANIIEALKTNPDDRRMVCSAWNPEQQYLMALPACHLNWVLTHIDGELSLHWEQRSCDLFLGVPFNIASYGLLLEIICKTVGMKPGNLSGTLCDCHIYENHIPQCTEQLERGCVSLPHIEIRSDDIFQWTHKDIKLHTYFSHPSIKGDIAV